MSKNNESLGFSYESFNSLYFSFNFVGKNTPENQVFQNNLFNLDNQIVQVDIPYLKRRHILLRLKLNILHSQSKPPKDNTRFSCQNSKGVICWNQFCSRKVFFFFQVFKSSQSGKKVGSKKRFKELVHFPLIGKGWQSGTYNFCTNWDLHTGFLSICVIFILKVWKRRWSWSKTSRNWDMPTQLMVRKVPKITPFLSTWPIMFLEYSNL